MSRSRNSRAKDLKEAFRKLPRDPWPEEEMVKSLGISRWYSDPPHNIESLSEQDKLAVLETLVKR